MARARKPKVELESLDDCIRAMRKLLLATLDHEKAITFRDQQVAQVMKEWERPIVRAAETIAELEAQLQQYYLTHLKEIEANGRKSLPLEYGVMGRRLGNPALKLLNRAWTWSAVLAKLRASFGERFLRPRDPEINKDKVKAELAANELREHGLKIQQDEDFYVEVFRPEEREA